MLRRVGYRQRRPKEWQRGKEKVSKPVRAAQLRGQDGWCRALGSEADHVSSRLEDVTQVRIKTARVQVKRMTTSLCAAKKGEQKKASKRATGGG